MFQVYFLSVLCNVLVGLFLIFDNRIENSPYLITRKKVFSLILGFSAFIIGVVKLFVVCQPDIILIGDLLPAIAGIIGGMCLLINYYLEYGKNQINLTPAFKLIFVDWKKIIGFCVLIIGVLHFILPQVRVF